MTVEELWQERLTEARIGIGRGLQPDRLTDRYEAETREEIKKLTNQATKEAIRAGGSMVTLDDLDAAEEKLDEAGNHKIVTDGGQPLGDTEHCKHQNHWHSKALVGCDEQGDYTEVTCLDCGSIWKIYTGGDQ